MGVVWMRAAHLVRRGWRSTVLLAVLAGLAAGVAMAMLAAGRRTATAYDRFAAYADAPDLLINFCLLVIGLPLLANVAAVYPAWRAARLSTAAALRAE